MSCTFANLTEDQVRARAEHEYFYGTLKPTSTAGEVVNTLMKLRANIRQVEVDAVNIDSRHSKKLGMKEGEDYTRYASDTRQFILSRRITDYNAIKFRKVHKGKSEVINRSLDSIISAGWGTKIHDNAQNIMENLVHDTKSANVLKNTEPEYSYIRRTQEEAMKEWGLTKEQYEELKKGIGEVFNDLVKTQREIDPKGKMKILTEQFIGDFLKDLGGTVDLMVVFSDGSIGVFDYKSKSPDTEGMYAKAEWDNKRKTYKLSDKHWIPPYSMTDFQSQIGTTREILGTRLKRDNIRFSRIIPIHVQFKKKARADRETGSVYTDQLDHLSIGSTDPFLSQIPIYERAPNPELDIEIRKLEGVIHNYEVDFDRAKGDLKKKMGLRNIIDRKREALDELILNQDLNYLYDDFRNIVKDYQTTAGELVDIDNPIITIRGEKQKNPSYLDWKGLRDKIDELKAYKAILNSSDQFAAEMNMNGQPVSDHREKINDLTLKVSSLLNSLEQKKIDRTITEGDKGALREMRSMSMIDKLFLRDKEFSQKAFRMFNDKLSLSDNSRRLKMQNIEREIISLKKGVQNWAKRNNVSTWEGYNKILGKSDLIGKYSSELYQDMETFIKNNDVKAMKELFTLKKDAEKIKQERWEEFQTTRPSAAAIRRWKNTYDLDRALMNPKVQRQFYEFSDYLETNPKYINDQYLEISRPENKELMDFWNYWTEKMTEARELLGLAHYEDLPYNFLPWIRSEINEMIGSGDMDMSHISEAARSMYNLKADQTGYGNIADMQEDGVKMRGKVDIMTGVEKQEIPIYFMNPLKNSKGQIDAGMKSRDLAHSLYSFLDMAYNYHYLTEIVEPHIEALRDSLVMYGQQHTDNKGNIVKDVTGRAAKFVGEATDLVEVFDRTVAYHVYDKKTQGVNAEFAHKIKAVKTFHSAYQLGFSWLTWAGNFAQIFYNTFQEGYSNYFFSVKDLKDASKVAMNLKDKESHELYKQLLFFFEPNSDLKRLKAKALTASRAQKIFNNDALYWGFRVSEHGVENLVLYSMLKNYGVVDGNIVKLDQAPVGTKSILEGSRLENGELVIDGIKEVGKEVNLAAYKDMRNRAVGVAGNIKGGNNSENQYGAQMTLAGQMMMHYKGWLPGMMAQRFSNLRYNDMTKTYQLGTYRAFVQDATDMEKGFLSMLGNQLLPGLAKLGFAAVTFPLQTLFGVGYKYKTNEARARRMFDRFKSQHKNDAEIQALTFEDYLEYQRSRVKALSAEVFTILSMYLAIAALRKDWDDDGVPDWRASAASRTFFRLMNRARREIAFAVSFEDWRFTLLKSPVPSFGIVQDAQRALTNALRETGDFVFDREDADKKGAGVFTYTPRMIPGFKAIRAIDILDPAFEKYEY